MTNFGVNFASTVTPASTLRLEKSAGAEAVTLTGFQNNNLHFIHTAYELLTIRKWQRYIIALLHFFMCLIS